MAFDFLGALSLEQLRELEAFLEEELEDLAEQVNTLRSEVDNIKRAKADLITADENFGGNALENISFGELPDITRVPKQDDSNSAYLVEQLKRPFIQNIKFKRERIEYKIKKLLDAEEQMNEMIDRKMIAQTKTRELINQIERLFTEDNANHLFKTTNELINFRRGVNT